MSDVAIVFNVIGLVVSLNVAFWYCETVMGRAIIVSAWFAVILIACAIERVEVASKDPTP